MPDTSKENPSSAPVTFPRCFLSYWLPGLGLIVLGFMIATAASADAISLGGFLCFFTLGVTLIVEGTKKYLKTAQIARNDDDHETA